MRSQQVTDQVVADATKAFHKGKGKLRMGQCYFNALPDDLVTKVAGTSFDPFYDDDNLSAFMDWLTTEESC